MLLSKYQVYSGIMLTLPYIQKQTPYMGTCLLCYSHQGFSTFREGLSHCLAVVICLEFIREPCAQKDQHEPSGCSEPHLWLDRTPLKYQQCIRSFGQIQTSLRKLEGFPRTTLPLSQSWQDSSEGDQGSGGTRHAGDSGGQMKLGKGVPKEHKDKIWRKRDIWVMCIQGKGGAS